MIDLDTVLNQTAIFTLRNGWKGCANVVKQNGEYLLRYEEGWRVPYTQDGQCLGVGAVIKTDGERIPDPPNPAKDIVDIDTIITADVANGFPV